MPSLLPTQLYLIDGVADKKYKQKVLNSRKADF